MHPVAIIGGGITGLTTAYELHRQKIPVVLYEATDRVGGPMQTIREKGYLSEFGPNTILETSPEIGALIHDLGLEGRRLNSDPSMKNNFVVRDGKLGPLPLTPPQFLVSPLFSLPGKIRVAQELLLRSPSLAEDESLADFIRRRLGKEILDYAINPFVSGIFAGDPEKLSVRHAFPKLDALEKLHGSLLLGTFKRKKGNLGQGSQPPRITNKVSFDEGLQVLPDTLQAKLGSVVQLRSETVGLRQHTQGWEVLLKKDHQEEVALHSAVVLTAPAHQISRMLVEANIPTNFSMLGEIHHPPVARIMLGYRREDVAHALDGFGFLVPQLENLQILGTTFSSSLFPNRAPTGHVTLTTFIGGCRHPDLAGETPGKLFDLAHLDLVRLLGIKGKPTYHHHVLYSKAIPQYNVGYQRFLDFMNTTEKQLPGLFFAGNYRGGISLGNSIVNGKAMANRVAALLPLSPSPSPGDSL